MIILPEYMLLPDGSISRDMALSLDGNAVIQDVFKASENNLSQSDTHRLCGLLLPGLVNGHCHLELSWTRGLYPEHSGIEDFYGAMSGIHSKQPAEMIVRAHIQNAIEELYKSGVVAIADISNTDITLPLKLKSAVYFHTFLEVFGTNPREAQYRTEDLLKVRDVFKEEKQPCSLSAHTLFTLSDTLMSLLMTIKGKDAEMHSIHFLESPQEKKYFENKTLIRNIHSHDEKELSRFDSAAEAACHLLPKKNRILFVHNTFADKHSIKTIIQHFNDPWFCLCPGSNLYISGQLPDVPMMMSQTKNIVLGTDGLSSNNNLNLFNEMDILLQEFPSITPESMLTVATINGARFLGIEKQFGSLEAHKKPGLVLLENYRPGLRKLSTLKVKRIA